MSERPLQMYGYYYEKAMKIPKKHFHRNCFSLKHLSLQQQIFKCPMSHKHELSYNQVI